MLLMILKMSLVTALYVLVTVYLWRCLRGRKIGHGLRWLVGVIFGIMAILSTHFGVDYGSMMLNVRDIGPMAAGLFFDPVSGIIAGLIGGIERYIAGTYLAIGSYTRIACSVSTCLAGFVAALMHLLIFKRKKPSAIYAFFMGAVMEVFHMYVVFITHRGDMSMALHVVKTCGPPMIIFTGLGLAASSVALKVLAREWQNPFRKISAENVPVSHKFQVWLFGVTMLILVFNFLFSFAMQTQSAEQDARATLTSVSEDIASTYSSISRTQAGVLSLAESLALGNASAIAQTAEFRGDTASLDWAFLERMRTVYDLAAVALVDREGNAIQTAGESLLLNQQFADVFSGAAESASARPSSFRVAAAVRCMDSAIQVLLDPEKVTSRLNLSDFSQTLANFHVGNTGTYDIFPSTGRVHMGSHRNETLSPEELTDLAERADGECFTATFFGERGLCCKRKLGEGVLLLTQLPTKEVYADRDAQAYETAFADIILFTVIYVMTSLLVQQIVVNNLDMVNASLGRITDGNLDEVVSVRSSSEFASLSNDINQTVEVLKGYIAAAEKRIEQELIFARTIQESSLPRNFSFPRDDFELFATMDPAKEVGGDFYDFFFVDRDRLALVIADVSGKGIPASLFMMRGKTAIRSQAENGNSPAEIFFKANNSLCEGNDAEMFITAWIGIIDLNTGLMRCANAGHEYPVVMRAGEDYALLKDRHSPALAAMEGMRFKEYEIQLNPGDRLFVYTDGIPEAINEQVEQYGAQRLVDVLNTLKTNPMDETLPAVRQNIRDFVGEADQFDDITMLGFVYKAEA